MSHWFGINWMRYHPDNRKDMPHIQRMGYKAILLYEWMWGDADFCNELLRNVGEDCIFIIRDHPLSEQKADMYERPHETGVRHGREWLAKVDNKQVKLPLKRCWFQGINEPDTNYHANALDLYTTALVETMGNRGGKVSGWVMGVGHPSTEGLKPEAPVNWEPYKRSASALVKYGGLADFHAYAISDNFSLDHHLARIATCPYRLPCVVSEFGIDWGIVEGHPLQGWKKDLSMQRYVKWLDDAQFLFFRRLKERKCPLDVKALMIFSYDSNSDWWSFDIREEAHLLENRKWREQPSLEPGEPIHVIHVPFVSYEKPMNDDEKWQRSIKILIDRFEGGLSLDPNDIGNYYQGQLVGTKYGISAASWGHLYDIPNLSREQAESIYFQHYWKASGADKQPWPTCYLHFDSAVQMGVGAAAGFAAKAEGNPWLYLAERQRYYVRAKTWEHHGKGWMNRNAGLMEIMAELWKGASSG